MSSRKSFFKSVLRFYPLATFKYKFECILQLILHEERKPACVLGLSLFTSRHPREFKSAVIPKKENCVVHTWYQIPGIWYISYLQRYVIFCATPLRHYLEMSPGRCRWDHGGKESISFHTARPTLTIRGSKLGRHGSDSRTCFSRGVHFPPDRKCWQSLALTKDPAGIPCFFLL